MVAAVLELCSLMQPPQTVRYFLFNVLVANGTMAAVVLLLVLWTKRLKDVGIETLVHRNIYVLYASLVLVAAKAVLYIVSIAVPGTYPSVTVLFAISKNAMTLVMVACALLFLLSGWQFYAQLETMAPASRAHMGRLALINVLVGVSLLFDGVSQFIRTAETYDIDSPPRVFLYYLGLHFRHVFRITIVLALLPVGLPDAKE
jgi:hypothetical protein